MWLACMNSNKTSPSWDWTEMALFCRPCAASNKKVRFAGLDLALVSGASNTKCNTGWNFGIVLETVFKEDLSQCFQVQRSPRASV